ncbi:sarcosine oxidase subunit delta [Bradyrhizobium elkanii]|uniref:Sarcosine oxidase subunit delta n=1 Tax=Bradyrhizobium elkanii TaxID=29448 RepID=A0A8I1YJM3_BRAEL|nr:sarcosine oxidase subunit delta [Bradyrhizobium elkanii]MBP1299804.1 sarcosine oxidase subunit delta [Bradyrhizobium elkanii]
MKLMPCPMHCLRNIDECAYLGIVRAAPTSDDDAAWSTYVFAPPNPAGVVWEWWCHTPSGLIFVAERDRRTDTILSTVLPTELAPMLRPEAGQ